MAGRPSATALFGAAMLATALAHPTGAETGCTADAMVVFDGSGSMAEMGFNLLNQPRIIDAREAVRRSMPRVAPFRRLGLIVYGPGQGEACSNVELHFTPQPDAAGPMIAAVDALAPEGSTPLTQSVAEAAEVLDYRHRPGVVVLVTDGKETCGGAPCVLAAELAAEARDLTVHVIGFKVQADHFKYPNAPLEEQDEGVTVAKCLADRTGGLYLSADTVDELTAALQQTLGCALIGGLPDGGAAPG